jgi:hypothetical protein
MNEALSKQDVQALRKADTVVFHHDRLGDRKNGNSGRIRCIKRTSQAEMERDPYAPQDREYELEVDSWITLGHDSIPDGETLSDFRDKIRGSEVVSPYHGYIGGNALSTCIGLMRVGDFVKLRWYYGAGNTHTDRANLHRDHLELQIERPQSKGVKLMTFLLRVGVCEDNSARMLSHWY